MNIVAELLSHEFMNDTQGLDMPNTSKCSTHSYDISNFHIIGVEGDQKLDARHHREVEAATLNYIES